jgi:hypothetical protein
VLFWLLIQSAYIVGVGFYSAVTDLCSGVHRKSWPNRDSEAELSESSVEGGNGLIGGSLGARVGLLLLEGVESSGLLLSLLLKALNCLSLSPAGQSGQFSEGAEVSVGTHAEGAEGVGDNHSLLLIVGVGDALEDLKGAERGGTSGRLVGEHASKRFPENFRGGLPVLGTTAWVRVDALLHHVLSNDLVSLQGARLEDLLATDDGNALAGEQLLGNNAGETALKVASSINDQLLFEHA